MLMLMPVLLQFVKVTFVRNSCCKCRKEIEKYSFGEATIWKSAVADSLCYVLNGQQRLITFKILLSVLRHLTRTRHPADVNYIFPAALFQFQDRSKQTVTRLQVRKLQAQFFAQYISSQEDQLGQFWDEEDKLQLQLAGQDTICRKFMEAAHVIKKVGTQDL